MSTIPNSLVSQINSTSYVDLVGLMLGETRLPGELASVYLRRLERIAVSQSDHSYQGALEQINDELGFEASAYIAVTSTDPSSLITSSLSGVVLSNATETVTVPVLTLDQDSVWVWKMLSDVAAGINASQTFQASLLVPDGPAVQIANQQNLFVAINEAVTGQIQTLKYGLYRPNTGVLSDLNNSFTVAHGVLTLTKAPASGTTFSYQYSVMPYSLVGSPVALLGMLDPGFSAAGVSPEGAVAYQVLEYLNAVMSQDRSYWGE